MLINFYNCHTFCLPTAATTAVKWNTPLNGAVKRPVSTSYPPPMFVTILSKTRSVFSSIAPKFLLPMPTKKATVGAEGADLPENNNNNNNNNNNIDDDIIRLLLLLLRLIIIVIK